MYLKFEPVTTMSFFEFMEVSESVTNSLPSKTSTNKSSDFKVTYFFSVRKNMKIQYLEFYISLCIEEQQYNFLLQNL